MLSCFCELTESLCLQAPYPMKGQAYHYVQVRVPVNARAGGAAAKQSKRELLSSPQPFVSAAWLISLRTEYEMANKISAVEVAAAVVERQPPYELPPFAAVLLLYALPTAAAVYACRFPIFTAEHKQIWVQQIGDRACLSPSQ